MRSPITPLQTPLLALAEMKLSRSCISDRENGPELSTVADQLADDSRASTTRPTNPVDLADPEDETCASSTIG